MKERNYSEWRSTFQDAIATWGYYTDFEKVYEHTDKLRIYLSTLNALVGYQGDIKQLFKDIVTDNPKVLRAIPILIAKREKEAVVIKTAEKDYYFDFKRVNYTVDEYVMFMEKNGLFDLLQKHVISNLYDYVLGVEVGLDSNTRKNRTGDAMEDLVEDYIIAAGFIKDVNYFKEQTKSEIQEKFGIDLSCISNNENGTEKRFDFVIKTDSMVYGIECNFYHSQGSKLYETARSYRQISTETDDLDYFTFVWITDGAGWDKTERPLKQAFDSIANLYNIYDMENGIIKKIVR